MTEQRPTNAIVVVIGVVVVATIAAATAVLLFAPGTEVAPLIGIVAPTVAALGALAQSQRVGTQVAKVDRRTDDLANGLMDSKVRAGLADIIHPDLLDPDAGDQLDRDRERRNAGHERHEQEA